MISFKSLKFDCINTSFFGFFNHFFCKIKITIMITSNFSHNIYFIHLLTFLLLILLVFLQQQHY
ncbi:hypothetical protein FORC69_1847 [Escherichia coli]|nr:hypothetical protein FORC69_1847 [Escherichia coli]KDX13063.1 hypothetical protein AD27_0309 [Escherichia coli 2-177-06_S4_C3]CCQ29430.2 hypothetical protein HUS2011_2552 [Escherichia coli]